MKLRDLVELAQKFAEVPENIDCENGLVDWDWVGSDIYLHVARINGVEQGMRIAPSDLDPEMVEVALVVAASIVEPNRNVILTPSGKQYRRNHW